MTDADKPQREPPLKCTCGGEMVLDRRDPLRMLARSRVPPLRCLKCGRGGGYADWGRNIFQVQSLPQPDPLFQLKDDDSGDVAPADETQKRLCEGFERLVERLGPPDDGKWTEYASKGRPMSTYGDLVAEARERYEPGKGPWSKEEVLDQVDLVYLEDFADHYRFHSDDRGLLSGCLRRLVEELRTARSWPTPPKIEPDFKYVEGEEDEGAED